jgi:hypothetical protein
VNHMSPWLLRIELDRCDSGGGMRETCLLAAI